MQQMPAASVDLIYLDPPFKSDRNYNLLYRNLTGRPVSEQADAFCDTWELDAKKEQIARTMPVLMREKGVPDQYVEFWRLWMDALRHTQPKLMAYLVYMVQRLLHMRPLLRPSGSIYLHCDPEASHYIKIMMDAIFGHDNFRNEIVWKRSMAAKGTTKRRLSNDHDVILSYQKGDGAKWNRDAAFMPYDLGDLDPKTDEKYSLRDDDGRRYQLTALISPAEDRPNLTYEFLGVTRVWRWTKERMQEAYEQGRVIQTAPGRVPRYKRYLDEQRGLPLGDIWTDIPPVNSQAKDRLGYQTQKPTPLLERIIKQATDEGDVVFDPFCGCGTTVYAAHETGRRWIGIDRAMLAVNLIQGVLQKRHGLRAGEHYDVGGLPETVEQAQVLAEKDPHEFQSWVIERVHGFPINKKGADRGIDGRMWIEAGPDLVSMIISVKGGHIRPADIRDLRGTVEREHGAIMGGFLSLREPTRAMAQEAASAGMFEHEGVQYEKIQMLTVADILERKREFKTPTRLGTKLSGQLMLGGMDLAKAR